MLSAVWSLALAIAILESWMGIILNAYIVVFSMGNVKKGMRSNRCDQVHLAMGMVNILLQCVMTTQGALLVIVFHSFVMEIFAPLFFLNMSLIYSSSWLTSWLCVVYCTSIATYTHQLFVWLKRRLSAFLPHLLLLSIAGSVIMCIPIICVPDSGEGVIGNGTLGPLNNSGTFQLNLVYVMSGTIFGCFGPLCLSLTSIILTISSLLQHIQNMRCSDMDSGQSKLQAHARAVKTMVMHLILVVSFYIAEMLSLTSQSASIDVKSVIVFFYILSYPTAQSAIIFQSNSKLRNEFSEMICLKRLFNRSSQDDSTES